VVKVLELKIAKPLFYAFITPLFREFKATSFIKVLDFKE
jgi:hypothetical protein